jgi:pimeloyl-ACP methyl ester carboxylesterase
MHQQTHEVLPAPFDRLGIERPWLFGHSDGGSIALLYASRLPEKTSGIVVAAPHIHIEDITVKSIRQAREAT